MSTTTVTFDVAIVVCPAVAEVRNRVGAQRLGAVISEDREKKAGSFA
jgi:hypothetical protein